MNDTSVVTKRAFFVAEVTVSLRKRTTFTEFPFVSEERIVVRSDLASNVSNFASFDAVLVDAVNCYHERLSELEKKRVTAK